MSGFWIRIDPRGCVVGSVYASVVGDLAGGAHKRFTSKAADRRREASEGYRHERVERDEWQRRARPCLLRECSHYDGRTVQDVPLTRGEAL
ncbi:MAG: hypothetical protein LBV60_21340 [Streptomyces sp.]|jgi:hypothetical protein|nr:hypothetical protein [Streptomyces sp.]